MCHKHDFVPHGRAFFVIIIVKTSHLYRLYFSFAAVCTFLGLQKIVKLMNFELFFFLLPVVLFIIFLYAFALLYYLSKLLCVRNPYTAAM